MADFSCRCGVPMNAALQLKLERRLITKAGQRARHVSTKETVRDINRIVKAILKCERADSLPPLPLLDPAERQHD